MVAWPTGFPAPAVNSFNEEPPDNLIKSSVDRGPKKIRRRTVANIRPISFTLNLTPDQIEELDSFYMDDLLSGAISFDYVHPRTLATVKARFAEKPKWADQEATIYKTEISLEILP